MKNCVILGSGRSGTSMLAGSLSRAGYYMGTSLLAAKASNPKGYFEDREINRINEDLLADITPARPSGALGRFFRQRPKQGQRWLAVIPTGAQIPCPPAVARRIAAQTQRIPFCFKDPRFSYTLPAWRPFLHDAVFLCVFREPARTAQSIVNACRTMYGENLSINFARALTVWTLMYRHILDVHQKSGAWLFVHYDQLLDGSALPSVEAFLEVQVDRQFPDQQLKRSPDEGRIGAEALRVYEQLCDVAGYGCREAQAA